MKETKDKKEKKIFGKGLSSGLFTKESVGAVGILFSSIAFLILLTGSNIFGELGIAIQSFLLGVFGYASYLILPILFLTSIASFIGKSFLRKKTVFSVVSTAFFVFLLIHSIETRVLALDGYLSSCFHAPSEGVSYATSAGWLGGIVVYFLRRFTSGIGAIIVLSLLSALSVLIAVKCITGKWLLPSVQRKEKSSKIEDLQVPTTAEQGQAPSQYEPYAQAQWGGQTNDLPTYVPVSQDMRRRPGVMLDDYKTSPTQTAQAGYSPFAYTPQTNNEQAQQPAFNSREFLFGGDSAENYRRNLIFDDNASVNKRPAVDPNQPQLDSNVSGSYSSYYAQSVGREPRPIRPETVQENTPVFKNEQTSYSYEDKQDSRTIGFGIGREEVAPTEFGLRQDPPVVPDDYAFAPREETPPTPDFHFDRRGERMEDSFPSTQRAEPTASRDPAPSETLDFKNIFSSRSSEFYPQEEVSSSDTYPQRGLRDSFEERQSRTPFETRERSEPFVERETPPTVERAFRSREESLSIFDEPEEPQMESPSTSRMEFPQTDRGISTGRMGRMERETAQPKREPAPPPVPKPKVIRPYQPVPLHFFDCRDVEPDANTQEVEENKRTIITTLDGFKVSDATIASVTYGPTVTRYNVAIPWNVSPRKVVALDQEIAIGLYAANGVNIYANFAEGAVSIEVPNKRRQFVQLGCMLKGDEFVNSKPTSLMFSMGKDVANRKVYGDIRKMTHLLVAGASGSGKSVFLRCLIISLIYKYSPEDLRLILIDPKKTEFVIYDHLPHLVVDEIINETGKVIQSLNWAIGEMNRRYTLFEKKSRSGTYVVNIDEYNANLAEGEKKLPKIVIIVDELADLMLSAKKDVEERIQNLTQKSRAAGIHMILATQRPSTDVITGIIKSNLKTRIAFSVTAEVDSRVILDATGAQKLLGKGDMLYTDEGTAVPVRVQSASIESEDAQKVVSYIKANNDCDFDEEATAYINNTRVQSTNGNPIGGGSSSEEIDPVYIEALRYAILNASASMSMVQRKCSVGYNKAGKIIEWMEDMGYVSKFDGAKMRKVLITPEEFEELYGPLDG